MKWIDIEPENWNRATGGFDQTCVSCGLQMYGTTITSIRGNWEHFDCVREAYIRITSQLYTTHRGTQTELIAAVKDLDPHEYMRVRFDRSEKTTEGRYFWEKRVES